MKPGKYKFVETKAPEGYVLNSKPIEFEIVKNQQTKVTLTAKNTLKTGGVTLTKVDSEDNKVTLEGAEFKLLDVQNKEIQTKLVTDKSGKITVENLKPGKYKFVETKAPEGYILDKAPVKFEIKLGQVSTIQLEKENTILLQGESGESGKLEGTGIGVNRLDSSDKNDKSNLNAETGDTGILKYVGLGSISMLCLYLNKRNKKNKKVK